MWRPKIYSIRWNAELWTIQWEEFEQSQKDDIGYFLDCDSGKANAIHWALEFANGRSNHLDKKAAKALCQCVWPYMRKTKRMQLRYFESLRG